MSIASEITRLQTAKADLKTAIEGKGVTVSSSAKLDAYPALVDSIQQGGSDDTWYLIVASTSVAFVYAKTNDTTWTMANPEKIELSFAGTSIYFIYKGETYYASSALVEGNNILSKNGQRVGAGSLAGSMLASATITKDASDNFSAYFETD
jgi:hypothetical protein